MNIERREIDGHLAERLDCISMHPGLHPACTFACGGNILNDARFVIREHQRNESRRFFERPIEVREIDLTILVDCELAYLPTRACEVLRRLCDTRMLDRAYRDLRRLERGRGPFDEHVVGVGPSGHENDLRRLHIDERGHLLASGVDGPARDRAELMPAGSVAVLP